MGGVDQDVVSADPGVSEGELPTVENGQVARIERVRGSSQVSQGTWVLSDDQLQKLGRLLWQISQVHPMDEVAPPNGVVLLDTEWKILANA